MSVRSFVVFALLALAACNTSKPPAPEPPASAAALPAPAAGPPQTRGSPHGPSPAAALSDVL